jgi:hypothetical protein
MRFLNVTKLYYFIRNFSFKFLFYYFNAYYILIFDFIGFELAYKLN